MTITTDDILYGPRTEGITINVESSRWTMEDIIFKFGETPVDQHFEETTSYCEFETQTPQNAELVRLVVENNWTVSLSWALIEDDDNNRSVSVEFKDGVITDYEEEVFEIWLLTFANKVGIQSY